MLYKSFDLIFGDWRTGGESFGIVLIEAMAAGSRVVMGGDNVGY